MRDNSKNEINKRQRGLRRIPMERTKSLFKGFPKTKLTHTHTHTHTNKQTNKQTKTTTKQKQKNSNKQTNKQKQKTVNDKCTHIDVTCAKMKTNWRQFATLNWFNIPCSLHLQILLHYVQFIFFWEKDCVRNSALQSKVHVLRVKRVFRDRLHLKNARKSYFHCSN